MLLAEELLLLALDPDKGTVPLGCQDYVKVGLSGALLAELALRGSIVVDDGRVVVSGDLPAEPVLAAAAAFLGGDAKGWPAKKAVQKLDKALGGVWARLVDPLIEAGVLDRDKAGPLSVTRHPVLDTAAHAALLDGIRAAAAGTGPLDPRHAVLLALAGPCRLLERVAPERSQRRAAKARIKDATEQAPFGPEVKKVIDDLIAAAAAIAAVTASTAAIGGG
jgi:hypothetical protein